MKINVLQNIARRCNDQKVSWPPVNTLCQKGKDGLIRKSPCREKDVLVVVCDEQWPFSVVVRETWILTPVGRIVEALW